ncbi:WhiB family transcriptional regulator [Rhodococcoides kyotonense]|uniref:Transcriptional regulator WhiB n=1 Tax=Rhodococcoides kyotonense TaxID=398843 RepID=A0A239MSG0_9NOCA|nr:WhiB family transcriptional regulator [Rhodococcus kyotonensis]SNT45034.1 WhiB family transcriptional regulator, redox-sensing transcriptional regulator [Rhodococcus kyotonensis]
MTDTVAALLRPVVEHWDWQLDARCRGVQSATFFPPPGLRGPTLRYHEAAAKRICSSCPVLDHCRQHAMESAEPYGIWGGLTASERADT